MTALEPISVIVRRTERVTEATSPAAGQPPIPSKWFAIAFAFARVASTSFGDYEGYGIGDTKAAAQLAARQQAETGLRRQLSASR